MNYSQVFKAIVPTLTQRFNLDGYSEIDIYYNSDEEPIAVSAPRGASIDKINDRLETIHDYRVDPSSKKVETDRAMYWLYRNNYPARVHEDVTLLDARAAHLQFKVIGSNAVRIMLVDYYGQSPKATNYTVKKNGIWYELFKNNRRLDDYRSIDKQQIKEMAAALIYKTGDYNY